MQCRRHGIRAGLTIIELLCVIAIIMVLAGLLLGPAGRVLKRVRADKWSEESSTRLDGVVQQLQQCFRGKQDFPLVTLEWIEANHVVSAFELDFLKDRRVMFIPFSGSDPDEKVIIRVELDRGYLTDAGFLTETKGHIARAPE